MAIKPAESEGDMMVPKPCPIPEGLVPATPCASYVEGGVACGKTHMLVERVASLLRDGAQPGDILVFCAAPDAAEAFSRRLADTCDRGAQVRVTTPREWCRDALASKPVRIADACGARMLAPFEANVLMEDLKVCGMRPQRLREMLKFFYKSMTQLCDWEEDWLLTGEEKQTYALLRECLDFEGAILEPELANSVARWLRDDPAALAANAVKHVVADDYQMLSRASQVLANQLASASIAVAANPALSIEVFESYPYAAGIDEFLAANPNAERVTLSESRACAVAARAVNCIADDELVGAEHVSLPGESAGELVAEKAETPAKERDLVVRLVRDILARGSRSQDVTVVAPNGVWAHNMQAALRAAGLAASSSISPKSVSGDLRELDLCIAARMLTALYLVADPKDGVAWRSWCGFGSLFLASTAVRDVREAALAQGIGAAEAFATMDAAIVGETSRAEWTCVMDGQRSASQILDGAKGKSGDELLAYLAVQVAGDASRVPAVIRALVAPFADGRLAGDDAPAMAARARLRIDVPRVDDAEAVRVVSFAEVTGTTPSDIILCGFVNGFFPKKGVLDLEIMVQEDADKQKAKDLRALMNVAGKATSGLHVTYFDEIALEMAERTGMKIRRVQLHDDRRVALSQPSIYLDKLRG